MYDAWDNDERYFAFNCLNVAIYPSVVDEYLCLWVVQNSNLRSPLDKKYVSTSVSWQYPWLVESRLFDSEYKSIISPRCRHLNKIMHGVIFVIPLSSNRIVYHFLMILVEVLKLFTKLKLLRAHELLELWYYVFHIERHWKGLDQTFKS